MVWLHMSYTPLPNLAALHCCAAAVSVKVLVSHHPRRRGLLSLLDQLAQLSSLDSLDMTIEYFSATQQQALSRICCRLFRWTWFHQQILELTVVIRP